MSDEELITCAKQTLYSHEQNTELAYFLQEDSDELEPFLLILRAVSKQAVLTA